MSYIIIVTNGGITLTLQCVVIVNPGIGCLRDL